MIPCGRDCPVVVGSDGTGIASGSTRAADRNLQLDVGGIIVILVLAPVLRQIVDIIGRIIILSDGSCGGVIAAAQERIGQTDGGTEIGVIVDRSLRVPVVRLGKRCKNALGIAA